MHNTVGDAPLQIGNHRLGNVKWDVFDINDSLHLAADTKPGKILAVELLGCQEKLSWKQTAQSLTIAAPKYKPGDYAFAFKVSFA